MERDANPRPNSASGIKHRNFLEVDPRPGIPATLPPSFDSSNYLPPTPDQIRRRLKSLTPQPHHKKVSSPKRGGGLVNCPPSFSSKNSVSGTNLERSSSTFVEWKDKG